MPEIQPLIIDLNTKGWDKTGGKSNNVWGQVPFPKSLLKIINEEKAKKRDLMKAIDYVKSPKKLQRYYDMPTLASLLMVAHGGKVKGKSSVWTAYDNVLYATPDNVKLSDLPKTISATFKSSYTRYGAVVENMGMRIAMALDLPTSYNYLVKFDKKKYQKILDNYPNPEQKKKIDKLGIVSIDFLQATTKPPVIEKYKTIDEQGKEVDREYIDTAGGDQLVHFEDVVNKIVGNNPLGGDQNLIEHWIKGVDMTIESQLKGLPQEKINKTKDDVHSRIARAFLLKEFLGDCDNTAYNGGLVINKELQTLRYAATFDYGDSFNKLIKTKVDKSTAMSREQIEQLPENVKKVMLARLEKEEAESVSDIAKQYATSDVSEKNMEYIFKNFPGAAKEFFVNLDKCIQTGKIENIVDSYLNMTVDGEPIMEEKHADIFKEYLETRSVWMCEKYVNHLQKNGRHVPEELAEMDFLNE